MSYQCLYCNKLWWDAEPPRKWRTCSSKNCQRQELIDKIRQDDLETLGKLADLILLTDQKVNHKEIKFTDKDLNKQLRKRLKK